MSHPVDKLDEKVSESTLDLVGAPMFILECANDGAIRFQKLNKAHVKCVGIPSGLIKGKTPHEFFPGRLADTLLQNYMSCRDRKETITYDELIDLENGEMWWKTTLSPVFNDEGDVIQIIGVAVDITVDKKKQIDAVNTVSELTQLLEDTNVFASLAAHDIRAPLRQIKTATGLVQNGFKDLGDNKVPLLKMIDNLSGRALGYVDKVVNYAGTMLADPTSAEEFELDHVLADIIALVDPKGVIQFDKPQGCSIHAETIVLQIILRNLLGNSINAGADKLSIEIGEFKEQEHYLLIRVSDNGRGFEGGSGAFAERIENAKSNLQMQGFGLAAISHLIKARSGKIWLDTPKFGKGTTISLTLPGNIIHQQ